jgi:hypothetical protein
LQQPFNASTPSFEPVRRAASAALRVQAVVGVIGAGLSAWLSGRAGALGFLAGATVVVLGQGLFGWRTLMRSPVVPAARAFGRLLAGSVLKWLVIGAGLALAMSVSGWPAGFVLGGALAALLAYLISIAWLLR